MKCKLELTQSVSESLLDCVATRNRTEGEQQSTSAGGAPTSTSANAHCALTATVATSAASACSACLRCCTAPGRRASARWCCHQLSACIQLARLAWSALSAGSCARGDTACVTNSVLWHEAHAHIGAGCKGLVTSLGPHTSPLDGHRAAAQSRGAPCSACARIACRPALPGAHFVAEMHF